MTTSSTLCVSSVLRSVIIIIIIILYYIIRLCVYDNTVVGVLEMGSFHSLGCGMYLSQNPAQNNFSFFNSSSHNK